MTILLALILAVQQPAQVALDNVTVIDIATGIRASGSTVLITGNRITAVGPSAGVTIPPGARRVDGRGGFVIPGLWDMHVHLSMTGRSALALFLASGVTGVRDMGGDFSRVGPWRDSVARGLVTGPRILTAGPIVERGNWLRAVKDISRRLNQPNLIAEVDRRLGLDSVSDGQRVVDSLAKLGVDFIKIRNFPPAPVYFAFARAARSRGLRISGHSPFMSMVGPASDSGFATFEHSFLDVQNEALVGGFDALSPADRAALFGRLARNGSSFDPTLVATRSRFVPDSTITQMIADTGGTIHRGLRYASPAVREDWREQLALREADTPADWNPIYQSTLRDVKEMAAAGGLILSGTDVPVVTLIPGYSLLDELELLVKDGGLTPLAALVSSTINPAKVLGLADSLGLVKPGYVADLIVLDRDPTLDISAVRALSVVIRNGRLLNRNELDRLREEGRK
ncbi:MAG TPA: amidohydrolase family protein [Gemmatimonadales bacterium]|nr:amidohydrolase family protein [Gemmatimonadales bacterium]